VASSASLVLLALNIERNIASSYSWLNYIGMVFAIVGIVYREATHWTVDRLEYGLLSKSFRERLRRPSQFQKTFTVLRRFVVRFFLFLPIVAWIGYFNIAYLCWASIGAFLLSYIPSLTRFDIETLTNQPKSNSRENLGYQPLRYRYRFSCGLSRSVTQENPRHNYG